MKPMILLDPSVAIDSGREKIWEDAKKAAFIAKLALQIANSEHGPHFGGWPGGFPYRGHRADNNTSTSHPRDGSVLARWSSDLFIYEDDTFLKGPGQIPLIAQQFCA